VAVPSAPSHPVAAPPPRRHPPSPSTGSSRVGPALDAEPSPGGSRGDVLLLVFFVATLIMVAAIVVVGSVTSFWVLAPVMLLDVLVTIIVIASIVRLLGDDGKSLR
jgi:hypothetical protein